jgi:muramoyltetrapeptide carboxypeptidase LdcA involved in peptidoglycan recycling
MAGLGENKGIFPYMTNSLRRTLFSHEPIGFIEYNKQGWTYERLDWKDTANQYKARALNHPTRWKLLQGDGIVAGHLLGGCAEVLEFLKGTVYWPSLQEWKGAILFIETSEEAPSPLLLERWPRNYGSQWILQVLAGILVGRPGGNISENLFDAYDDTILKVARQELV